MDYRRADTIYHYTNPAGLTGILESQSLWLFDLRSLNDERELIFGQEIFLRPVCDWFSKHVPEPTRSVRLREIREQFRQETTHHQFFSVSFCTDNNSAHLWDNYAQQGKGAAIGFDPFWLKKFGNTQTVQYPAGDVSDFAVECMSEFDARFSYLKGAQIPSFLNPIFADVLYRLRELYLCSKEKRWEAEQEVRILSVQLKPQFRQYSPLALNRNGEPKILCQASQNHATRCGGIYYQEITDAFTAN